ncbi:hypothetical protein B0T11DRAFT_278304 [Plectosphaerella cucumerina]|uniref:Uncharacterized protein n=1 Tax=Plectosphaerella cucumerina TaxID=40658 RepID=A0A8K0TP39_9PEZI|nr:hypothetical protein B0T11DRAFT_278304 [Plectosphaerella cucumerina]
MENPWASPWATAESDSVAKLEAAAVTSPEPPPAAFFSSTPNNNINLPSGHSAWTEDESFGDWAAPEPTPSAAPSGWGIWGSGDTAPADGHLTPRLDRRRQGSNPQWPNSRSTSPGLRPPPLSKRSSSDHLALDPWASELSYNRRDDSELHIQHLPSLPTTTQEDFEPPPLRSRASNISIVIEPQSPAPIAQQNGTDNHPPTHPDSEPPSAQQDSTASPASSVSEGGGGPGNVCSDSPITPAEEAASAQDDEKTSSKVQKLVTMFDGIARKSSFTPELVPGPKRAVSQESTSRESMGTPAPRSVTSTPAPPANDDQLQIRKTRKDDKVVEEAALAGGEEGKELSSLAVESIEAPEPVAEPPSESLPEPSPEPASVPISEQDQAGEVLDDETTGDAPQSIHHEPFKVDLEKMDELFTGPKSHVTGDDVTVPDRIITDSFETISERKAWYRISRYGPMRQHNAGDDENYVRISWASSSIRPEIITTVRRWMEEDSMGGRTYRGAAGKGAGGPAFGWNQPSTPVSLEEFFRRGKSGRGTPEANPRQSLSSLPPPNPVAMEQRPLSMPPSQAPGANAWSGLASFGWASEASTRPASPGNPAPVSGGNAALPSETKSFKLQAPPKKSQSPTPPPIQSVEKDESDDEWGEMVTPSAPEFPSKPVGFGREKPAEIQRPQPPAPVTNGSGATASTSQSKPPPFSGWNDTPLAPILVQTKESPIGNNTRSSSQDNARLRSSEESAPSVEVIPKSKPRKKVAFGLEESPPVADPDTATDAAFAREFIAKLPDLSYMLR